MLTKEEITVRLKPIFEKNNTNKAILFGSYAKGTQVQGSDVDILVDSGLHGLKFYGLLQEVCSSINAPVDLIDIYQLKNDGAMKKDIEETGILIYERT